MLAEEESQPCSSGYTHVILHSSSRCWLSLLNMVALNDASTGQCCKKFREGAVNRGMWYGGYRQVKAVALLTRVPASKAMGNTADECNRSQRAIYP